MKELELAMVPDAMIGAMVKDIVQLSLAQDWDGLERFGLIISEAARATKAEFNQGAPQ